MSFLLKVIFRESRNEKTNRLPASSGLLLLLLLATGFPEP